MLKAEAPDLLFKLQPATFAMIDIGLLGDTIVLFICQPTELDEDEIETLLQSISHNRV